MSDGAANVRTELTVTAKAIIVPTVINLEVDSQKRNERKKKQRKPRRKLRRTARKRRSEEAVAVTTVIPVRLVKEGRAM